MGNKKPPAGFVPVSGTGFTLEALMEPFCGRSVFAWAVKVLLESKEIGRVFLPESAREFVENPRLSTDDSMTFIPAEDSESFFAAKDNEEFPGRAVVLQPGCPLFDAVAVDACLSANEPNTFRRGPLSVRAPGETEPEEWLGAPVEKARLLGLAEPFSRRMIESYINAVPAFRLGPDTQERARGVRLLALDVDGVLTDAGFFYDAGGEALKKFNTRDGLGLRLVRDELGINIVWITGEDSPRTASRAARLGIEVFPHAKDKVTVLSDYCEKRGLTLEEVAFMGDDRNDVTLLRSVGLACAPADAYSGCLKEAHFVSRFPGGRGCVRELCELLLELGGFDGSKAPPPLDV